MAREAGAEDVVHRMLALGAPLPGYDLGYAAVIDPLEAACVDESDHGTANSSHIVRTLLSDQSQ